MPTRSRLESLVATLHKSKRQGSASLPAAKRRGLVREFGTDAIRALLQVEHLLDHHRRDGVAPAAGTHRIDPDTAMMQHTLRAARRAAGGAVKAVDMVCQRLAPNAFCSIRPPGHHAESAASMGFCFYNNVAVAATHDASTPAVLADAWGDALRGVVWAVVLREQKYRNRSLEQANQVAQYVRLLQASPQGAQPFERSIQPPFHLYYGGKIVP